MTPDNWRKPSGHPDHPDLMVYKGRLYVATATRQLAALLLFQARHRTRRVRAMEAWCMEEELVGLPGWQLPGCRSEVQKLYLA